MRTDMKSLLICLAALAIPCSARATGYKELIESLNPVGYWRLGESAGTTAVDQIGVSNGVYRNSVTLGEDGAIEGDGAAHFDGSNDYVEIPHDDAYLLDAGAVSVWFKADSGKTRQEIFSKDSTNFDTGGHLTIMLKSTHAEVRIQSASAEWWLDTQNFDIRQWNHLLFTWGPDGCALYLNGELEDTDAYTGGLGATSGGAGNFEPIVIGANAWASNDLSATPLQDYFDGMIDEVVIFGFVPSGAELAELASPTGGAIEPIRVVEWRPVSPVSP